MTKIDEHGFPEALFIKTEVSKEGDYWRHTAFFDMDALSLVGCITNPSESGFDSVKLAKELTGWSHNNGYPGGPFSASPFAIIQPSRNRVVVQQYGGYDV